ncbi:MAG TPA: ABC-2 family transporter protein [Patescibacteria group bacterium]|nr:ABC-2 family transporter protein [Patescibacteria group bacterium]
MFRYFKLYQQFVRINWKLLFAYRASLLNHVVNSLTWSGFLFISVLLLTNKVSSIAGWDRNALLLLAGMYNLVMGIYHSIFAKSLHGMAEIVLYGKLDAYLLKPFDSQFHLSLREVNIPGFLRCVIGIIMVAVLAPQNHIVLTVSTLVLFLLTLTISVVFLYSSWFSTLTLLIWFPRMDNLIDLMYGTSGLGRYPKEVIAPFHGTFMFFLLLPFFLVVSIPTKVLLDSANYLEIGLLSLLAVFFLFFSRYFWKFALRSYSGGSV